VDVSLTLWVLTILGLCALIAVDFLIGGRNPHEVSIREAAVWTAVWMALAALFCGGLLVFGGGGAAGQFAAGFITEKSLSVDNLFVFVLIMTKFAVPLIYQQRVLLIGVLIALVLRAVFIAAGAAMIASFSWIFYVFGAFLVWTAWKLIQEARSGTTHKGHDRDVHHGHDVHDEDDHDEDDHDEGAEDREREGPEEYEENRLLKAFEKRVAATDRYHGTRLVVRVNGRRLVTPMLIVMLAIGTTDVLFALDSIPAIFGLTQDPYIVFTANAFALMGLRQLYFLLGGLLKRLVHLSYGLSVILGFIGVKLVLHALHESGVGVPEISTPVSLGVIVGVLAVTTATSLLASRREARAGHAREREHART
jgi:tellurite resistance protein TerC